MGSRSGKILRMARWLIPLACLAIGIAGGANLDRLEPPMPDALALPAPSVTEPAEGPDAAWSKLEYRNDGQGQPCPKDALVIAIAGQSNVANSVGGRFKARRAVFEWQDGNCFPAAGPLSGADGERGNYWPLVGDALVASGKHRSVVLVGLAKSGTGVAQWANPKDLGGYLAAKLGQLNRVDFIVWQQGERDVTMSREAHEHGLRAVVQTMRDASPGAKVMIGQSSLCFGGSRSDAVLMAQEHVATTSGDRVGLGPNTDVLNADVHRYDGCHFSPDGARAAAKMWARALSRSS
jgi:hypothetical protein